MTGGKIDFVILWVNHNDGAWSAKKNSYLAEAKLKGEIDKGAIESWGEGRYYDIETLKYLLRSMEKYAPWSGNIHLVVDQQVPCWLRLDHPKLRIINHEEFFADLQDLPTFNSHAIQINLGNISGLSEHFVLFDDDFLLTSDVKETDFFQNGLPVDFISIVRKHNYFNYSWDHNIALAQHRLHQNILNTKRFCLSGFKQIFNSRYGLRLCVRNLFNLLSSPRTFGFNIRHYPIPYLKSTLLEVKALLPREWVATSKSRFRKTDNLIHWSFRDYQLANLLFCPSSEPKYLDLYLSNDLSASEEIIDRLQSFSGPFTCIHTLPDFEFSENGEVILGLLIKGLDTKFPQHSSFEVHCSPSLPSS